MSVTKPRPDPADESARGSARPRLTAGRVAPVAMLAVGLVAYFVFDLDRFLSLEALKAHRDVLTGWVAGYGIAAGIAYAALYALTIAFSIPGGTVLTVIGGFLFGPFAATIYVVFGATIGATVLFLAARHAFAAFLRARAGPALKKMESGFNENPVSYMLILRLVPLFPFWLVNLVPAFLGVSTTTYVISTFFGIMPGTLVYALLGDGAGAVLDAGRELNLGIIFETRFIAPIIGLMALACIPVIYKRIMARRANGP